MKNFLTLFLLFCFSPAMAADLQQAVAKQALDAAASSAVPAQNTAIQEALKKEVFKTPRRMTWQEFRQENEQLQTRLTQSAGQFQQFTRELYALFVPGAITTLSIKDFGLVNQSLGSSRPDYAAESKDIKYIYIGERHGTATLPQETNRILQAVRQANPHARILLATELVARTQESQLPLWFVGEKTSPLNNAYPDVSRQARSLDMDILALEEDIAFHGKNTYRIGDTQLAFNPNDPEFDKLLDMYIPAWRQSLAQYQPLQKQLLEQQKKIKELYDAIKTNKAFREKLARDKKITPGKLLQEYEKLYADNKAALSKIQTFKAELVYGLINDFVSTSAWGVERRNETWTRYIQALSPFYDIVILYAGDKHLQNGFTTPLPQRIFAPRSLCIHLETDEAVTHIGAAQRKRIANMHNDSGITTQAPAEANAPSRQQVAFPTEEPMFIKRELIPWQQYKQEKGGAHAAQIAQLEEKYPLALFQQTAQTGVVIHLDVYLPDSARQK